MHINVTLAVVLYTLGTSMAWALDDTPTLAPRYMPRPDDGRAVNRTAAPLPSAAPAAAARAAAENDALPANVRSAPLRPQPLPLTRVLPAEGHGAPVKLPAKPL
ncbi:hypothetical protein GTP23_07610 [Pseudoduganella sp. FT93W]|uniref:Uncharacterized protein n=1 Tax=Duganella fentianensis TaxID=2692177 RepID=A0A845HU08_9BURK|nr:hypothetical protein [Duganella fentianensis]MYN44934.1 hypothetical protein [Duganella fentianensis]